MFGSLHPTPAVVTNTPVITSNGFIRGAAAPAFVGLRTPGTMLNTTEAGVTPVVAAPGGYNTMTGLNSVYPNFLTTPANHMTVRHLTPASPMVHNSSTPSSHGVHNPSNSTGHGIHNSSNPAGPAVQNSSPNSTAPPSTSGPSPLFCGLLTVLVRVKQGEAEKMKQLTVAVSSESRQVKVVVTDPADYLMHYSLSLPEEDFPNLKSQQGLLVDFSSFPAMVVQLLQQCQEQQGNSQQHKFVLVLNCTGPQVSLDFTELSMFKHLVHLSLVVMKANDSQLKEYLVHSLNLLSRQKEETSSDLQKMVHSLQTDLAQKNAMLEAKMKELGEIRVNQSEQASSLGQRLAKEVGEEKERAGQALQEMQSRLERERREVEARYVRNVQQLENRVASLDVQNRDLVEVRYRHEASLREAKAQLASQGEELARVKGELGTMRQEKERLESSGGDRDRKTSQLTTRLAVVEQELADKGGLVRQQQEMVRQGEEGRERLAREVEEKQRLVERREKAVKTVTEELMKANEIISKMSDQVKQQQGKVMLRGQIATEQERLLGERDKELTECREQLREGKEKEEGMVRDRNNLASKLEDRDRKIEDLEKMLKTNENVINWLNKQVTTAKVTTSKDPEQEGVLVTGKLVRGGKGGGRGKTSPHDTRTNGTVAQHLRPGLAAPTEAAGLDAKYFEAVTPGGTQWLQEIPKSLPTNVLRGKGGAKGGLLRQKLATD